MPTESTQSPERAKTVLANLFPLSEPHLNFSGCNACAGCACVEMDFRSYLALPKAFLWTNVSHCSPEGIHCSDVSIFLWGIYLGREEQQFLLAASVLGKDGCIHLNTLRMMRCI